MILKYSIRGSLRGGCLTVAGAGTTFFRDLVPAEDEAPIEGYISEVASAPTPPLPPPFLSLLIRRLHTKAAMAQMRAAVPSTYHSLLPSRTPPLLPIPLPVPSTSRRAEIPEADTPPQKRLLLTAPRLGCEVGESSAATAVRQPGPTMARSVDCGFVDTMETRFRDTERRMMITLEMVNKRVSYQVDARSRESLEFYSRHHDAQEDRAAVRAEIEARVVVLETQARRHEWQRQSADDFAVQHIMPRDALRSTNGDDSHNSRTGVKRTERATRDCTYTDFLNNYAAENQVKFATCTLHFVALTWWNTHVKIVGHDAAYGMPWKTLMKMMTDNYCPRNEIKKLEMEIWDLKVKGTDLTSYTQRFQELALLCGRMFSEESDKIEKYIRGLPDMIHGSVVVSKPKTMQEAVAIATELMDQKIRTFAEREMASKRKLENTLRSTQNQQQPPNKRQNTGRVYTATSGERKEYAGTLPLCNKCKFHHNGRCTIKCANCKRVGHLTQDCRSPAATNNHRNPTCYECGNQWHYRSDCLELKNQDHGNQAGGTGAHGMVHALKGGETNQDPNDVEEDINA
nr:hypothetical protein [Tanacetum cinerariifolium]